MIFTKMQGTGNDFVVIEDLNNELVGKESEVAKKLCHRRFGIGADGILLVRESHIADVQMVIINADGSYAEMCGNGIRCFAKYVYEEGIVPNEVIKIETGDGIKTAFLSIKDSKVQGITINMGNYSFKPEDFAADSKENVIEKNIIANGKEYKITSMLMGVPHTVVMGNIDAYETEEGKYIEKYPLFKNRTNVNFCQVIDKDLIKVKTWERGAGPTLACGTGSCASAICANYLGYTNPKVKIIVPGGELIVEVKDEGVLMTGPAEIVYKGEIFSN
ncbi:diaminopimelate epimerase [Clostridium sp. MB40-C1]|uniref:diaminopimelate epimerase n=1 Tax=Clostridium sp. MB40-C1 TaxID=3070996 RepID=UPI0027DF6407|nr:diaminopimelate epimerase [Clostridium sp. MB40-C1]WMJ81385.1 diaminopimelate epimerase [Clostridium sp. MB40-C1]